MSTNIGKLRLWWTKISRFEFWPFSIFYLPVFCYYGYLALKSRSLFFFTASNPSIEFGGMTGEKKSEIFDLIPNKHIPKTRLFPVGTKSSAIIAFMEHFGLAFPIILKPDIGDRGWMVKRIDSQTTLEAYLEKVPVDFLAQEFVDYPIELGVFYIRQPGEDSGAVTSIVKKGFLTVTGDGQHTSLELLRQDVRALLQVDFGSPSIQSMADTVPAVGEEIEIEAIGNHCLGTTFYDAGEWIDDQLTRTFDEIASSIDGFYFGRFDLRCRSREELIMGQHFKIVELNGAGAEPGHIYQPGFPLLRAYKDVMWHLQMLQKVSEANRRMGHKYWKFSDGWNKLREVRAYNRLRTL